MNRDVSVFVSTRKMLTGGVELVLESMEGNEVRWSKVYDGSFFLSMDAESLGLVEPIPDAVGGGPEFRLKRSGAVQPEQLARMQFVKAEDPNHRRR